MENNGLAYHETMELHEMLNFKTTCLLKSKMMSGLVFDQELKALMEKDVQQTVQTIEELRAMYKLPEQLNRGAVH